MRSTTFEPLFDAADTDTAAGRATTQQATPQKSALWSKLYTSLIEARQAQANAIVARHMAFHDDATLKSIGWTDSEISDLRRRVGRASF